MLSLLSDYHGPLHDYSSGSSIPSYEALENDLQRVMSAVDGSSQTASTEDLVAAAVARVEQDQTGLQA